jgi:hypothetical protein
MLPPSDFFLQICLSAKKWKRWYFAYQESQFRYILDGHGIDTFGQFYGHLEYFAVIWFIFLVVVCILYQENSGNS